MEPSQESFGPCSSMKFLLLVEKGFECKVSSYLCRWLGVPRSLSSTGLYGNSSMLRLPFSSIREEFIARAREHLQYLGLKDAIAGIIVSARQQKSSKQKLV